MGNKHFRDITQQISKLFDKVRDHLDSMQDEQIEKLKSSQMVRNGIFNGVANQIDSLIDRLGDEIEEEQEEDDDDRWSRSTFTSRLIIPA